MVVPEKPYHVSRTSLSPTHMPQGSHFSIEAIQPYHELVNTIQSVSQDGSGDDVKNSTENPDLRSRRQGLLKAVV